MNIYRAFGLTIASEIVISELLRENSTEIDVTIKLGKVPDTFENIIIQKHNKIMGKNKFILDNKDIAKYFVENGKSIIVEPYDGALFQEVKLYLLGSCMGAILYQRGILPLHGSCLNIEGQGTLITGVSGAGKSTIATVLSGKGYKILTDDVTSIRFSEGDKPIAYPSYPHQKLWEDVIERMDKDVMAKSLNRISNDMSKYSVAMNNSFCDKPIELSRIYEIVPSAINELIIEEVKSAEKLNVVMKNTYRRFMSKGFDMKEWHFNQCTKIANKVLVYRIKRPKNMHLEKEIANVIIAQMAKSKNI